MSCLHPCATLWYRGALPVVSSSHLFEIRWDRIKKAHQSITAGVVAEMHVIIPDRVIAENNSTTWWNFFEDAGRK